MQIIDSEICGEVLDSDRVPHSELIRVTCAILSFNELQSDYMSMEYQVPDLYTGLACSRSKYLKFLVDIRSLMPRGSSFMCDTNYVIARN